MILTIELGSELWIFSIHGIKAKLMTYLDDGDVKYSIVGVAEKPTIPSEVGRRVYEIMCSRIIIE